MRPCNGTSEVRLARSSAGSFALLLLTLLVAASGCATKRPTVRPPITPGEAASTSLPPPRTPEPAPVWPGVPVVDQPQDADPNFVVVPGLNRVYPSEDPANLSADSAPEAFPRPGRPPSTDLAVIPAARTVERAAPSAPRETTAPPVERAEQASSSNESAPPANDVLPPREEPTSPPAAPAGAPAPAERYCIQLFATGSEKIAESRRKTMASYLELPLHVESENGLWKVRSSAGARTDAQQWLERAVARGYADAFLVPVTGGARP